MKILFIGALLFIGSGLISCENHMDIRNIVEGTPTNADTVLPHSFSKHAPGDSAKHKTLARVFWR